jgi:hypothetical protein
MTSRSVIVGARRMTAIAATLGLFAVAAVCVHLVATTEASPAPAFSGEAFRAAMLTRDGDALRDQAHAAVDSQALIGLSPKSLRRTLGDPARTRERGRHYEWDLGEDSSRFFGGSGVAQLYVDLDVDGRRVERAEIYQYRD